MSQPATKIWCPKCHKRHRLPANAGGMTLRCRGCQFAFRVQDGLTQDPGGEVILLGEDDAVSPAGPSIATSEPAHYASAEVFPVDDSSSAVIPARTEPSNVAESNPKPAALDHDFDDILDVLDAPISEPMAPPPRAHAKGERETTMVPYAGGVVAASGTPTPPSTTEQRQPVSRSQLRAHRNSRQFWMLMSLLFACFLGMVSWFAVSLFMKPDLSDWERKMLYAMGAPARWLPPQEGGAEALLPTDHVKLRGDHIELADRNDNFRDDFFVIPPEREDEDRQPRGFAENNRKPNENRNPDNNRIVRNQMANREAPRAAVGEQHRQANPKGAQGAKMDRRDFVPPPNQRPNRNFAANNNGMGRMPRIEQPSSPDQMRVEDDVERAVLNRNLAGAVPRPANRDRLANRRPNNNRGGANPKVTWKPPKVSDADMRVAVSRGIDPKTIQTLSVETDANMNVALVGETVFSIAAGNRLTALDIRFNERINSRKLDRKVAAMCAAVPDGVSNRPAAWVLYDSGQLEKWELLNSELNQVTSVQLKPVFKEKRPVIASGAKAVATCVGNQIFLAEVLEAAARLGSTISVPVDGPVSAMRFSKDGSQLLAVTDGQAMLINAASGAVISKTRVEKLSATDSQSISADLSTLFVVSDGTIDSVSLADGVANGKYWASVPTPLTSVVSGNGDLLGLSSDSPSHAVLFSAAEMVRDGVQADVANNRDDESSLLQVGAANVGAKQVHELSRSPEFAGRILAVQALPGNRIAFLSDESGRRRVGVATWGESWSVAPLTLAAEVNIKGFHMSNDLSKVAIFSGDVVQTWSIEDVESGKTRLLSEAVSHTEEISRVMLSNDGAYVVSGDLKGNVHVSNFESGKKTGSVSGFKSGIVDIVAKGDEGFVVMDRRGVANGSSKTNRDKITPFGTTVSGAATLSRNGNRIAYQSGSEVRVADVHSQKIVGTIKPKNRPHSIRFSQSQRYVLLQDNEQISVWDWRKGERIRVLRLGTNRTSGAVTLSLAMDDSAAVVVTGDSKNRISVFELSE